MATLRTWLSTRSGILVTMLALLVLLDLGRSAYARVGYAQPVSNWEPDPKVYADIVWPPGSDLPANARLGQQVYAKHCQVCHGPDGRGNGPAAPSLIPRPRDFTTGQFKYKSTAAGQPPSDNDLRRTVVEGLNASAMPYWKDLLNDQEVDAVIQYIKNFSPSTFGGAASQPVTVSEPVAVNADSIARGKQLYAEVQCNGCHGDDGRAMVTLKDAKGYPVIARDLTAPWTFRWESDPAEVWLRITTGMLPGPMPSFADKLTPEQRWDVVNYVTSLARPTPWEAGGKLDGPGQQANLQKRGEYLVHAEMCQLCHTQINRTGIYREDDFYLAGGMRVETYPHGVIVSRNLTSDKETGLGNWSEEQITNALRNGRSRGRVLDLFDMPWAYLHNIAEDDAVAIAKYLKSLPPVHNEIPAPLHFGVLETILNKLSRPPPAFPPTVLTFANGRFGQDGGLPRDLPQTLLVGAQWLVLVLGVGALVLVTWRTRRLPKRTRGWIVLVLGVLALAVCGLIGSALYELPMLGALPPDQIVSSVSGSIPVPAASQLTTAEQKAFAERGRYIFTVASCALCHNNDGSGGVKVSWKPFGTLWTRNLTPDPETGLGKWSDEEIARAIRSGVSRDGYQLHWQGMIWDLASNWDEQDIHALITYLRVLPPVRNKVLADRSPSPDDCEIYTFWATASSEYGCK